MEAKGDLHMTDRIDRVIITGAGSGIGLDMARAFLARGSRLVVNGRDADKLERARRSLGDPARILAVPGHVGDPATARALAAAARERLGGVDVLVNNAGIFAPKPFLESTAADLERFFETNVKGTYLVTQAIVPLMIEGGGGSIINVGAALVEQAMTGVPASAGRRSWRIPTRWRQSTRSGGSARCGTRRTRRSNWRPRGSSPARRSPSTADTPMGADGDRHATLFGLEVTDDAGYAQYRSVMAPILARHGGAL